MGRIRNIPASESLAGTDFQNLIKQEKNAKVRVKLIALENIKKGEKVSNVAKVIGINRRTVNDWINYFIEFGIDRLRDKGNGGRKSPIFKKESQFKEEVLKMQNERPGGRIIAKDVQKMLKEKFNADRSTNVIYDYLKKVNLVWISSRSKHPKSSALKQQEFKENFTEIVKKNSR